jgi:hypothetical protein
MNAAVKRFMRAGNGLAVLLYRRSNGRIGGAARGGTRVLLLTVPGRKSGTPHTTPVSYFEDEGGYVVAGTAAGRKQDPQWFRNLRAASRAHVELVPGTWMSTCMWRRGPSATVSGARSSWPGRRPSPRTRISQGV